MSNLIPNISGIRRDTTQIVWSVIVVAALALPFLIGILWRDLLERYYWIITVVSLEMGAISILANVLYHR